MKPRTLEITRYFTAAEFILIANELRKQDIVDCSLYLDLHDSGSIYYNPQRFYSDETEPELEIMLYGPIYHNDNHL